MSRQGDLFGYILQEAAANVRDEDVAKFETETLKASCEAAAVDDAAHRVQANNDASALSGHAGSSDAGAIHEAGAAVSPSLRHTTHAAALSLPAGGTSSDAGQGTETVPSNGPQPPEIDEQTKHVHAEELSKRARARAQEPDAVQMLRRPVGLRSAGALRVVRSPAVTNTMTSGAVEQEGVGKGNEGDAGGADRLHAGNSESAGAEEEVLQQIPARQSSQLIRSRPAYVDSASPPPQPVHPHTGEDSPVCTKELFQLMRLLCLFLCLAAAPSLMLHLMSSLGGPSSVSTWRNGRGHGSRRQAESAQFAEVKGWWKEENNDAGLSAGIVTHPKPVERLITAPTVAPIPAPPSTGEKTAPMLEAGEGEPAVECRGPLKFQMLVSEAQANAYAPGRGTSLISLSAVQPVLGPGLALVQVGHDATSAHPGDTAKAEIHGTVDAAEAKEANGYADDGNMCLLDAPAGLLLPSWPRAQFFRPGSSSVGSSSGYNSPAYGYAHIPLPPSWAVVQPAAAAAAGHHVRDTILSSDCKGNGFCLWEVSDVDPLADAPHSTLDEWLEEAAQDGHAAVKHRDSVPTHSTCTSADCQSRSAASSTGFRPLAPSAGAHRLARGLPIDHHKQEAVKEAFLHAWAGYKTYAWGHDQLKPVSRSAEDPLGSLCATLVDSLDTLLIMGLRSEYVQAEAVVLDKLQLINQEDVNLFETTIRVLGGLLSAWELTNRTRPALLSRAQQVADALLFGFDSPSGIPYGTLGMRSRRKYNPSWVAGSTVAEVGTLLLEWEHLSAATGEPKYALAVRRALASMLAAEPVYDSLWPTFLNPEDGAWSSQHVTLGARGDSTYEYLLKYPLLAGVGRRHESWGTLHRTAAKHVHRAERKECANDGVKEDVPQPSVCIDVQSDGPDGLSCAPEESDPLNASAQCEGEEGSTYQVDVQGQGMEEDTLRVVEYTGPVGNPALLGPGRRVDAYESHGLDRSHTDTTIVASWSAGVGEKEEEGEDEQDHIGSIMKKGAALLDSVQDPSAVRPARTVPVQAYAPSSTTPAGRAWAAGGTKDSQARYARYEVAAREMMGRAQGVSHRHIGGQDGANLHRPSSPWSSSPLPPFHPGAHLDPSAASSPGSEAAWFTAVLGTFWRSTAGVMHQLVKLSGSSAASSVPSASPPPGTDSSSAPSASMFAASLSADPEWARGAHAHAEAGPEGRYFFLAERQGSGDAREVQDTSSGDGTHVALHYPPGVHFDLKQDHLACFTPGMMALAATVAPTAALSKRTLGLAKALMRTCMRTYTATPTCLAPEIVRFTIGEPGSGTTGEPFMDGNSRHTLLRPETVESLLVMYRVTGDPVYRAWGWKIFVAINNTARVPSGGFSSVRDVHSPSAPGTTSHLMDSQETFFLAETLKYLYLLFGPSEDVPTGQEPREASHGPHTLPIVSTALPLDEWVFNTEAHPLPVWPMRREAWRKENNRK